MVPRQVITSRLSVILDVSRPASHFKMSGWLESAGQLS
jgi:hypothetical protein